MLRKLAMLFFGLILTSCVSAQVWRFEGGGDDEYEVMWDWHARNQEEADSRCPVFHTDVSRWGQVIGCQSLETLDARSFGVTTLVNQHLVSQGCDSLCRRDESSPSGYNCSDTDIRRPFTRTQRHFLFLDKESRTLWYVPENYYSDGLSIPDWLVRPLAFLGQGTADPKTLPSALSHDRYICLYNDARANALVAKRTVQEMGDDEVRRGLTRAEWRDRRQLLSEGFRRKGCANDAFENALQATGNSNFLTRAMRTAVGWANSGLWGYCPQFQYNHVAALDNVLDDFEGEAGGQSRRLRDVMRDCHEAEPVVLCLSDRDNLRDVLTGFDAAETTPDLAAWFDLGSRVFCLDHKAARSERVAGLAALADNPAERPRFEAEWALFRADDVRCAIQASPYVPADLAAPAPQPGSPLRAGDLWIEIAPRLNCTSPASALDLIADAATMDDAMVRVITWNRANIEGQLTARAEKQQRRARKESGDESTRRERSFQCVAA